jgi:hypothetical protein
MASCRPETEKKKKGTDQNHYMISSFTQNVDVNSNNDSLTSCLCKFEITNWRMEIRSTIWPRSLACSVLWPASVLVLAPACDGSPDGRRSNLHMHFSDKKQQGIQVQFNKNLEEIEGNQLLCASRSCLSREGDERMNAPPGVCSPLPPPLPAAGSSVLSSAWFVGRPTK